MNFDISLEGISIKSDNEIKFSDLMIKSNIYAFIFSPTFLALLNASYTASGDFLEFSIRLNRKNSMDHRSLDIRIPYYNLHIQH